MNLVHELEALAKRAGVAAPTEVGAILSRALMLLSQDAHGRSTDKCQMCLGAKGGAPGNENVIGGVVMCDDCHALYMDARNAEAARRITPTET